MISIQSLLGAAEQGLIYSLVAMGLYISYRVLEVADLTTDGSFTLGAACSACLATTGNPLLGLLMAFVGGVLAGAVTAFLQTVCKIQPILAGIITMTGLYSINLMVMGNRQNLPLLKNSTLFTIVEEILGKQMGGLVAAGAAALLVAGFLVWFLSTQLGLMVRAAGNNPTMLVTCAVSPAIGVVTGLCLANGIIALSGGLLAQQQKFSDSNLGTGMVVVGLASLIIGETIVGKGKTFRSVVGILVGSVVYRIIIALALRSNLGASNLKLVSAVIVAIAISLPAIRSAWEVHKRKKEAAAGA